MFNFPQPDQNEALAAKDDIIAQLHEEIDNLHAKLKEKNDLIGDIITKRLEMAESESNKWIDMMFYDEIW